MRDRLAEKLLAKVLEWTSDEIATERPLVQALAAYKYDEYQQYSAGSRFVESLAVWLNQFETNEERRIAYEFLKNQLIFCSSEEMLHLVEMAYPDHIRPILLEQCAKSNCDRYRPSTIAETTEFKIRQRECLFLGLSDGARIDAFRRSNATALNHEQIWQTYEIGEERVVKLRAKLKEHLVQLLPDPPREDDLKFRTLVLLDDFSASGTSYYAHPAENPEGGKITTFFSDLCGRSPVSELVDVSDLRVLILLYMATEQALDHLRTASTSTWEKADIPCTVSAVQVLPNDLRIARGGDEPINQLIDTESYYDPTIHDAHMAKGRTSDSRYGYGDCGLPLVLHHNTPNNSVALLMSYEDKSFCGLFPRIQRHKEIP